MSSEEMKNEFVYTTQGTQDVSKLRNDLNDILALFKQQDFTNKETNLIASFTQDQIDKIADQKAWKKSVNNGFSKEEHFEVAKDIAPLYENATLKETHSDYRQKPNIANVHRFHNDALVNGKNAIAKITVFEKIVGKNRIYSIELKLSPSLKSPCVQETETAKSLSSEPTAHNETSIYCDSGNGIIPQDSNQNQADSIDLHDESIQTTHKRKRR